MAEIECWCWRQFVECSVRFARRSVGAATLSLSCMNESLFKNI